MFHLYVDSDCDVTLKDVEKYNFKMISMPYFVGDEVVYPYKDGKEIDFKKFYDMLRTGVVPKTSALNVHEYLEIFEKSFAEGKDILYVHFSAAMTCTFNSMKTAVDELLEKYPERRFEAVDTKMITMGALNLIKDCGELYLQGKSMDEIKQYVIDTRDRFATYFYASNLKFFAASGRISNFAAFMGGMINLKALIHINNDGEMKNIGKCRGTLPTLNRLVDYMEEKGFDKSHRIIIAQTDDHEDAVLLESLIRKRFGDDIIVDYCTVNPTAGGHCGPDNVGVSFLARER